MNIIRELFEDFKAWRRGERRIAPRGSRGRIYVKKDGGGGDGHRNVAVRPTVTVGIRKIHADGTAEEVGTVPGTVSTQPNKERSQ